MALIEALVSLKSWKMAGCSQEPRAAVLYLAKGFRNDLTPQEEIMSIAPASSNIGAFQPKAAQDTTKPIREDFRNLASTASSGDLAGAKDAFAAVQRLLQSSESGKQNQSQGGAKPINQLSTNLVGIGKALLTGGLGAAQNSVSTFLGDIQAARGRSQHQKQGVEGVINSDAPPTVAGQKPGSKPIGSLINTTA